MSNTDSYATTASNIAVTSSLQSNSITLNDNYTFTTNTIGTPDWGLQTTVTTPTWTVSDNYYDNVQRNVLYMKDDQTLCWGIPNKEKKEDKNNMANEFDFGPYEGSNIRLSTYGIALKNKTGKWVSYDKEKKRLMDVDVLNIPVDTKKLIYKVPKAVDDVDEGDVVIHNGNLVIVEKKQGEGRFLAVDPIAGTEYVILPAVSPFGFDYLTTIISLAAYLPAADKDNPFGSMLPLMLSTKDNNGLLMSLLLRDSMYNLDPTILALMLSGDVSSYILLMMLNDKEKKKKEKDYEKLQKALKDARAREKEQ